jgi:hypothetical protein
MVKATESVDEELLPYSALMNGQGCGIELFLKHSLPKKSKAGYITIENIANFNTLLSSKPSLLRFWENAR